MRSWVIDFDTLGEGHVFTDLAKWMASGLFLHAPLEDDDPDTERLLWDLLLLVASVPEDCEEKQ